MTIILEANIENISTNSGHIHKIKPPRDEATRGYDCYARNNIFIGSA